MTATNDGITEAEAWKKWHEIAPLIDRMMQRVGTENEFPVMPGSALAGDDTAASPYQVSHAFRLCMTAGVDHLHAAKVLVVDNRIIHIAAPSSLARGALENFAAAYWMLGPKKRDDRVSHALKWHAQNVRDAERALGAKNLPGLKPLATRLAKLEAVAAKRGLDTKEILRGYTSTAAVAYSESNATAAPLGVLLPWQVASGFAHGRLWAYLGMSELVLADTAEPGVVGATLTSDAGRALYPSLAALQFLQTLLRLYHSRSGAPI